jgi:O-antigen/teichoic acid export membrane protein
VTATDANPESLAPTGRIARIRAMLGGTGEAAVTGRLAGAVFLIRVLSAAFAYGTQVLLARWMGGSEFGIYVYVWTWVLLIGSLLDLGTAITAQKFIPQYRGGEQMNLLRGFLFGSRWFVIASSVTVSAVLILAIWLASDHLDPPMVKPLIYGCLILPAFVLANMQDGVARSWDWINLALMPQFIFRQALLVGCALGAVLLGWRIQADEAMMFSVVAVWAAMIGQMILLDRRLRREVTPGARTYDFRLWIGTSLPIVMVEGFYLLLNYTDVLILQLYRSSEEVGIYHAIVKTLVLISFVHYAIGATTAHRFSEYHASGDRERLSAYLAYTIKWTFWPSLGATALLLAFGKPMLWLFGPNFTQGYPVMFVLAVGLVARAAVGPVEKLLNMIGQQRLCALAYAWAFVVNVALCVALIPRYGAYGAAASTSAALVCQAILLFWIVRYRLGFRVFSMTRG